MRAARCPSLSTVEERVATHFAVSVWQEMTDGARLRSPSFAVPDDDDEEDEVTQVAAAASSITATAWWLGTTMVMLAAMLLRMRSTT